MARCICGSNYDALNDNDGAGAMSTQDEKSESCDCCGFETTKIDFYKWNDFTNKRLPENKGRWLCDLCAGTMTSTYDEYPRQHTDQELTALKTICYVGNAILRALEKRK